MDLALWIAGGWLGLAIAVSFPVAAFIRDNRGSDGTVPLPIRGAGVRQPGRGAPPR